MCPETRAKRGMCRRGVYPSPSAWSNGCTAVRGLRRDVLVRCAVCPRERSETAVDRLVATRAIGGERGSLRSGTLLAAIRAARTLVANSARPSWPQQPEFAQPSLRDPRSPPPHNERTCESRAREHASQAVSASVAGRHHLEPV